MAFPPVDSILLDAAKKLGDPTQEIYKSDALYPYFAEAYGDMWNLMMNWKIPAVQREGYYTLPANTTSLTPATAGIADFGEPFEVWERGSADSTERFAKMEPTNQLPQIAASRYLRYWMWENDTFNFIGAVNDRYLKLVYSLSAHAPASGQTVGINGSDLFLSTRTASLAAPTYGMPQLGAELRLRSLGPSREPDGTGGLLRALVNPMLKERHKRPSSALRFRPRRNWG